MHFARPETDRNLDLIGSLVDYGDLSGFLEQAYFTVRDFKI